MKMTLEKQLFNECFNEKSNFITLADSLKEKYLDLDHNNFKEKRDITIEIMEYYHRKYFEKFSNLFNLFEGLKTFEVDFLYKYLNYYRDHFLHSLQVFLLGINIVRLANHNEIPIEFLSKTDREAFFRTWFLISIYHDVGYLAQKLIEFGERIDDFYFRNISGLNISKIELKISEQLNEIFINYLEKISFSVIFGEKYLEMDDEDLEDIDNDIILNELIESFKERNHGIISALFLYYTAKLDIKYIEQDKQFKYLKEIDIACSAIATHDLEKKGKLHLDFHKNPFASLLILCDNLQEWNRPFNIEYINESYDIWKSLEIEVDQNKNLFKFILQTNENSKIKADEKQKIIKNIMNSIKRIFSYSIISGPNFSFIIKHNENEYKLNVKMEEKPYYIISSEE